MVDIYRGLVKIPREAWHGCFKAFVLSPPATYGFGVKGDVDFIKDAAEAMWGSVVLKDRTVTGKQCNANPKRGISYAKPGLEADKLYAIQGALKRRILIEKEMPLPPDEVCQDPSPLEDRIAMKTIKFQIGRKIHALKKTVARRLRSGTSLYE